MKRVDEAAYVATQKAQEKLNRLKELSLNEELDVKSIMEIVKKHIELDYRRHSDWMVARKYPIGIGYAYNATTLKDAKIFLIDSSTKFDDNYKWMKHMKIQAKSRRPYMPSRGDKADKGYFCRLKSFLDKDLKHAGDFVTSKIIKTGMKHGFYKPVDEKIFNDYAPKITLLFANIESINRAVFMLRPSRHDLRGFAYQTYSYIVLEAFKLRTFSEVDLITWAKKTNEEQEMIKQSLIVKDDQLVVKEEEAPKRRTFDKFEWPEHPVSAPLLLQFVA